MVKSSYIKAQPEPINATVVRNPLITNITSVNLGLDIGLNSFSIGNLLCKKNVTKPLFVNTIALK